MAFCGLAVGAALAIEATMLHGVLRLESAGRRVSLILVGAFLTIVDPALAQTPVRDGSPGVERTEDPGNTVASTQQSRSAESVPSAAFPPPSPSAPSRPPSAAYAPLPSAASLEPLTVSPSPPGGLPMSPGYSYPPLYPRSAARGSALGPSPARPSDDAGASDSNDGARSWRSPHLAVEVQFGVGAPTGLLGATLEVSPTAWLVLNAGAGEGAQGTQIATMGRLRLPLGDWAVAIGGGYSFGNYDDNKCWGHDCNDHDARSWEPAHWLNADLSVETRAASGFEWRLYTGFGTAIGYGFDL